MAKKIKADALASEVMKELDVIQSDYGSDEEGGQECRKNSPGGDRGHRHRKRPELMEKLGVKKTGEDSKSLQVTVHSKNRYQIAHLLEHGHAKGEAAG